MKTTAPEMSIEEKLKVANAGLIEHKAQRKVARDSMVYLGKKVPKWLLESADESSYGTGKREFNPADCVATRTEFVDKNGGHHNLVKLSPSASASEKNGAFDGNFSFGLSKARLILALIPSIQDFVNDELAKQ